MSTHFKVHFIGIGGIGVSALARYYLEEGWRVSGSDLVPSEITGALEKLGVEFYAGTKSLKKRMPDLVIYSPAVRPGNPELKEAGRLGIKCMSYPEALGELTKQYFTIAVAGAHGKSTTTAMIALMMQKAGLDPTVVVGTKVREFGNSNFRYGRSKYLVIEACEYSRSFLNYWPQMIALTNIEVDHLECYKSLASLTSVFGKFASRLPENGVLVANNGDPNTVKLFSKPGRIRAKIRKYSISDKESAKIRRVLKIPGEHNVANALAAMAVGRELGISEQKMLKALSAFRGVWRRFDCASAKFSGKKITVVSDYGHHPTQIRFTLEGARAKWPGRKIICVYQPHQAYRTFLLFKKFAEVFRKSPVDEVLITDIYEVAGREDAAISKKVSSQKLVKAVGTDSVKYVPRKDILACLRKKAVNNGVVIVMGAGSIYELSKELAGLRRPHK